MNKHFLALAVAAAVSLAAPAVAATPFAELPPAQYPGVLSVMATNGMKPVKQFEAAPGLRGWVMKQAESATHTVIYTPDSADVVIVGTIFDDKGRNLSSQFIKQHVPAPDHSAAYKAFSAEGEAASVVVGKASAKAEISVLFDANCGYCKLLTRLLAPSVAAGELRIRYVPVAIMGDDSDGKGAALLAAKDPDATVSKFLKPKSGPTSADVALLAKVKANTALMSKFGFSGTPAVLYKDKAGTLMVSNGLPSLLPLYEALGIPSHAEALAKEPDLQRFIR